MSPWPQSRRETAFLTEAPTRSTTQAEMPNPQPRILARVAPCPNATPSPSRPQTGANGASSHGTLNHLTRQTPQSRALTAGTEAGNQPSQFPKTQPSRPPGLRPEPPKITPKPDSALQPRTNTYPAGPPQNPSKALRFFRWVIKIARLTGQVQSPTANQPPHRAKVYLPSAEWTCPAPLSESRHPPGRRPPLAPQTAGRRKSSLSTRRTVPFASAITRAAPKL